MKSKWIADSSVYPGVIFEDITHTFIEPGAKIEPGCYIEVLVRIDSKSTIKENTKIFQGSIIKESVIGAESIIGQYTLIRNNTILLGKNVIGPQSEISDSTFHEGASAYHKAFVSNSSIGEGTQIGASFITANSWHDGNKYDSTIGENVKIGVNVTLVAPVNIERNSIIAAGSTITDEVKENEIAFARARQVNKGAKNEK
ncbi:DapH/DapD/GlmU-related protein [Mycoplasma marinum]|nr:DapH/DapD/GlmU-related protein [Mycoplasma marinum]